MMEIKDGPAEIFYERLIKIKCKNYNKCWETVNYLVLGDDLYCSQCFSELQIKEDEFINLKQLSPILEDLVQTYDNNINGEQSQINFIKAQLQKVKNEFQKNRLNGDINIIKSKSTALLNELYGESFRENRNEGLEGFFEFDPTETVKLSECQLILQNLKNLKITKDKNKIIHYQLQQLHKNPQMVDIKVDNEYCQLEGCIDSTILQAKQVIDNFMKGIAEEQ